MAAGELARLQTQTGALQYLGKPSPRQPGLEHLDPLVQIITVRFIIYKVAGGLQGPYSNRDLCESKARMKPFQTLNWLDFSSVFWLILVPESERFAVLWLE